jgi:hypothetical protein
MLHVRDTMPGPRGSAPALDHGSPGASARAAHAGYPRRLRGSTARSRGPDGRSGHRYWHVAGPRAAVRPTLPVTILWVERPAGRHCCHLAPIPHASAAMRAVSKQAVAGLVRAADSRPGRATAAYCRSATVPGEAKATKHPAARTRPTCDCCHDLPHRAVAVASAMPAGRLVVRVGPGHSCRK